MEAGGTARTVRLGTPLANLALGYHNGPGLRISFWTQGCSLRCTKRCLNPHLLPPSGGYAATPDGLSGHLLSMARDYPAVEGISVLGGEPFDQAAALALTLSPLRQQGLSIMVYTGHTHEQLLASGDPGALSLLATTDVLVDGPFLEELHDPELLWRGSSNQRLLLLTSRYSVSDLDEAQRHQGYAASLAWGPNGEWSASGAQTPSGARHLRLVARAMARGGLP